MDMSNFDSMLQGVADAFGKSLTAATKAQYYSLLGNLTDDQWRKTCEVAKADCENFPKIVEMRKLSYQFAPPVRSFFREEPTVTCVCKCRASWAWNTITEFHTMRSCRCWECHTTYDHAYLEAHREGPLIDLSGDAEEEKRNAAMKVAPAKVVEMLERELQF